MGFSAESIAQKWFWGIVAMFFVVLSIALSLALIVVTRQRDGLLTVPPPASNMSTMKDTPKPVICGSIDRNGLNIISLTEPEEPGPFHDLTADEIKRLRKFLEQHSVIKAAKPGASTLTSATIFTMDLFLQKKQDILRYLDMSSVPPRYARVILLRGDKDTPVVEEWACGPLSAIESCRLLTFNETSSRNPVEFSLRPFNPLEMDSKGALKYLLTKMENELGAIVKELYNVSIAKCEDPRSCVELMTVPMSSEMSKSTSERQVWISFAYHLPYQQLHPLGMSLLCYLSGVDPSKWYFSKIWYSGRMFNSSLELKDAYAKNLVPKVIRDKSQETESLFSTLHRRGDPQPAQPQRPPKLVEPDGKRYSLKDRKVTYLNWNFHFRMSTLSGPALYDVRFKGERIAYEIALNELASFYSGYAPFMQTAGYVDSGLLAVTQFKSLVLGSDCPDTATLVNQSTFNLHGDSPFASYVTFCLFEINNGFPLRRHMSYKRSEGGFYGGKLDSALTLRSIFTIFNYDYVLDFVFHQNGVLETKIMATGYIISNTYHDVERPYGFRVGEYLMGSLHHHLFQFKVDLDIAGTKNRYQTLDIQNDVINRADDPQKKIYQNKIVRSVKMSELDALYTANFDTPKQHLVYNNMTRNAFGEHRGYRISIEGVSKSLLPEDVGNERTIPWARHQMAVTKHKDSEIRSSSAYGMFDSANPVVNFTQFYQDDENIVDEDLVFWITCGTYHIPKSEDLPLTTTVGTNMGFYLLPFNYHKECPSMSSRDAIYIQHDATSEHILNVNRNRNMMSQCLTPPLTLEADLTSHPDLILETKHDNFQS